jgi:hypothetical protein
MGASRVFHSWGISIPSNACAEHEMGIKEIRQAFGPDISGRLDEYPVFGVGRRKITRARVTLIDYPEMNLRVLWGYRGQHYGEPNQEAEWSNRGFCVQAPLDAPDAEILAQMHQHFVNLNIVIYAGQYEGIGGLHLLIADKISDFATRVWEEVDRENFRLRALWLQQTGPNFEKNLRDAGCDWFSLGQTYTEGEGQIYTWLNPFNQRDNHFGWFTPEDLRLWAKGEGRVVVKVSKIHE